MNKICFFNSILFWGGGEKWHLEAATALKARGWEVLILTHPEGELAHRAEQQNIPLRFIEVGKLSSLNPRKVRKLSRILQEEQVDTLIINGSADLKIGAIAGKKAKVRNIIYRRGTALPVQGSWFNKYIFKRVLTHIIANSEATKQTLLANMSEVVSEDKVTVIYNGIHLDDFLPSFKSLQNTPFVIGNIGRLVPQKGQMYLIELAELLNKQGIEFEIRIGGSGELQEALEEEIAKRGLADKVLLEGFVENQQRFLSKIHLFVLSSLWEGFGYVMVESMAVGKPVLAFDMSSNKEIVKENVSGFLVKPKSVTELAERILELKSNPQLYEQLCKTARLWVQEAFDIKKQTDELEHLLSS